MASTQSVRGSSSSTGTGNCSHDQSPPPEDGNEELELTSNQLMLEQQYGSRRRPDPVDNQLPGRIADFEPYPPPENDTYLAPDDFEEEWTQMSILTQYIGPTEPKRVEEPDHGRADTSLQTELNTLKKLTLRTLT